MTLRTFRHTSLVDAAVADVWRRVTSFDGINAELGPVLRMRTPPALRDATLATVPLGVPLGRAWILLFGVLPVEYTVGFEPRVPPLGGLFEGVLRALFAHRHRRLARAFA